MTNQPTEQQFKTLTAKNWLLRDTTADCFVHVHPNGETSPISNDGWARLVLEIELRPAVPRDVRDLFAVAQGVLCYGCFFYPLYTLGNEQVFRVLEAALTHKYRQLRLPRSSGSFVDKIDGLFRSGHLDEQQLSQWHAARKLRNASSHPDRQTLIFPTTAIGGLQTAADLIDDLFMH